MTTPDAATEPALAPELTVSDLAASLAFYVDAFGFAVRFSRPEDGFAAIEREGAWLMLEQYRADGWNTGPLERPFGRGVNFEIGVSDVDALRARIAGPVFVETEAQTCHVGDRRIHVRQFCVQDPDGYLLRFQQVMGRV